MHRHPLIVILLACTSAMLISGCREPGSAEPGPLASPASLERDRGEVIQAHEALVDAYERGDIDAFVGVLDASAELLIFHPRMEDRFAGVDDVRRRLPRMFARLGGAEWSDHHAIVSVNGDVAWLTSQVLVESAAASGPFLGRGTEIYVRRSDGWKLVHGHWSTVPES